MLKKRRSTLAGPACLMAIAVLFLAAGMPAKGATLNARVLTDKGIYNIGDTVNWTVYMWASKGDNRGIALLSVDMHDDTVDTVQLPALNGADFAKTAYGTPEKFLRMSDPVISSTPPDLRGILVMQLPYDRKLDIGNDGRTDRILAHGSYTITEHGWHTLSAIVNAANYWPDSVSLMSTAFEVVKISPARIRVGLAADVNADFCVNMLDYSILAAWWGSSQCGDMPYCDGADITADGSVDLSDAAVLAGQWLSCDGPDDGGLKGDVNKDHYVNMLDISVVARWWGHSNCDTHSYCDGADATGDGQVDFGDAAIIASQWLWCDDPTNHACISNQ
ncbi:MAG: hypothetical protein IH624_07010 [Phycisphaerae bacterium]|nr:hypothetical protein [Phycisphaerae bacterium]